AGARHHLVMRVRSLDGVAEQHDEPDVRESRGHPRRYRGVEKVVRRRLAGLEVVPSLSVALPGRREREERAVPVDALRELLVEEMQFLCPPHRRVPAAGSGDIRVREKVTEK